MLDSVPAPARRATALILTLGAVAAGSLTSLPAQAAPACDSIDAVYVRDTTLSVGITNKPTLDVVAAVSKKCKVSKVKIILTTPSSRQSFDAVKVDEDTNDNFWGVSVTLQAKYLSNSEAGTWSTTVSADNGSTVTKNGPKVKVQRAARVSANAKPEPVRKGKKITITGKLQRANWETGHYAGYAGRKVALQWRSTKGSYSTVKTVTTGKGGSLQARVTAKKDGCYRYVFAGSGTTTGAKSKSDCVDVR